MKKIFLPFALLLLIVYAVMRYCGPEWQSGAIRTARASATPQPTRPPQLPPQPPQSQPAPAQYRLTGQTDGTTSVVFTHDGGILAAGNADHTIAIWDHRDRKLIKTLEGHTALVIGIAFSADDKKMLSGDYDGQINLWDVQTGRLIDVHHQRCPVAQLGFLGDSRFVSVCGDTLRVWSTDRAAPVTNITAPADIAACAVNEKTHEIFVGDSAGHFIGWNLDNARELFHHTHPAPPPGVLQNKIVGIVIRPSGKLLVGDAAGVWQWDRQADTFTLLFRGAGRVIGVSSDDTLFFGSTDNQMGYWACQFGPSAQRAKYNTDGAGYAIALSKDNYLAYGGGGWFAAAGWKRSAVGNLLTVVTPAGLIKNLATQNNVRTGDGLPTIQPNPVPTKWR